MQGAEQQTPRSDVRRCVAVNVNTHYYFTKEKDGAVLDRRRNLDTGVFELSGGVGTVGPKDRRMDGASGRRLYVAARGDIYLFLNHLIG